jgi:hypothetical protein
VNNDPNLLYWIDQVLVFGSFLTESEVLGDVDLGLMYTPREEHGIDWSVRCDARVELARANGRNFRLYMDAFMWPMHEILLRLRKGSGSLSLHDLASHRTFIEALPHRQIYLRRNGTHSFTGPSPLEKGHNQDSNKTSLIPSLFLFFKQSGYRRRYLVRGFWLCRKASTPARHASFSQLFPVSMMIGVRRRSGMLFARRTNSTPLSPVRINPPNGADRLRLVAFVF